MLQHGFGDRTKTAAFLAEQIRDLIGTAERAGPAFDLLAHLLTTSLVEADRLAAPVRPAPDARSVVPDARSVPEARQRGPVAGRDAVPVPVSAAAHHDLAARDHAVDQVAPGAEDPGVEPALRP
jgi:hypothetical protein